MNKKLELKSKLISRCREDYKEALKKIIEDTAALVEDRLYDIIDNPLYDFEETHNLAFYMIDSVLEIDEAPGSAPTIVSIECLENTVEYLKTLINE